MMKFKHEKTNKGFIVEEINKQMKVHNPESGLENIDTPDLESAKKSNEMLKKVADERIKKAEKDALKVKGKDYKVNPNMYKESIKFKNKKELSEFLVKLKEENIRRVISILHEDAEGFKYEVRYEKLLEKVSKLDDIDADADDKKELAKADFKKKVDDADADKDDKKDLLKESYESAFEICKDGSKCSAIGSFHHTRNYTHELVEFKWKKGTGNGDYRWMNRPWERFTFASALQEAMIEAGVDSALAKKCIEESGSLSSALKYFSEHCCEEKNESLNEADKVDEAVDMKALEAFANMHEGDTITVTNDMLEVFKKALEMAKQYGLKESKEEPKLETFDEQMDFLAKDEQEAIDGYHKVLDLVADEHVKEQLEKILVEEEAHKAFLEAVKEDHSLEYVHEEKEEKEVKIEKEVVSENKSIKESYTRKKNLEKIRKAQELVYDDDMIIPTDLQESFKNITNESKKMSDMWDFGDED